VQYFIYVDGKKVDEGYEIASTQSSRFGIEVKCKKYGLDTIYTLIGPEDDFHIWSYVNQNYVIDLIDTNILCEIDPVTTTLIVSSFPNKRLNEVILYRKKNTEEDWSILRAGDRLSILEEWEFHISTFNVL